MTDDTKALIERAKLGEIVTTKNGSQIMRGHFVDKECYNVRIHDDAVYMLLKNGDLVIIE